jgi:hypothetical protein
LFSHFHLPYFGFTTEDTENKNINELDAFIFSLPCSPGLSILLHLIFVFLRVLRGDILMDPLPSEIPWGDWEH